MLEKIQGGPLRPDPAFAFCQAPFLMTFATDEIPHAGSRQTSLFIRGMQITITMSYHFTSVRMANIKKNPQITNVGEDVVKKEPITMLVRL